MKKILAILLALAMVFALCACGDTKTDANADTSKDTAKTDDKVYNVSIQFSFPEASAEGALKTLNAMTEESGGRLQFDIYYSYSFVDAADVIDALDTNQLDIAGFMPCEHPAEMPINGALMALPLMNFPSWQAATKIYLNTLYNTPDMLNEFTDNGMVLWAGYMCPGYQVYSTKEMTETSPSLFKGLTVMCDQAQMQSFIDANKGGSISAFPPDYLSNLQNGVADALVQHVNCAYVFGTFDYVKTAYFFGDAGFYNLALTYGISQTFWDSLPEDLQNIFAKYASMMCYESQMSDEGLYSNVALPDLESKANIITLNETEIAEWQSAFTGIVDAAIDEISKDNSNARSIYDKIKDTIANYNDANFEIGTNNFGLKATWGN